MRDRRTLARRFALAMGIVAAFAAPARAEDETLEWISDLPGLVRQADKTVSGGTERVFAVDDGRGAIESVKAGLRQRGWTLQKSTTIEIGLGEVSSLRATRGSQRIKASVTGAPGSTLLVVTVTGAAGEDASAGARAGSPSARRGSPTEAAGAAQAIIGSLLGGGAGSEGGLAVFDNGVEQTHSCQGRKVAIHGNASRLTFTGDCPEIAANGNNNTVVIAGRVAHIQAAGNGNTISWSAEDNPQAPRVSDLGRGNRITRTEARR